MKDLKSIIEKAKEIHGDTYDYSMINEFHTMKQNEPIICKTHGIFYKDFQHHIYRKQGCPFCAGKGRYTTESFVNIVSKLSHCQNYSFEKVNYVNNKTKVIVTCKEHGDFEISPGHLLSGEGCPKCRYIKSAQGKRRSIEEVIALAREVHGDRYDYSLITDYKNDRIKYPIICPEHGVFYQVMNNHIKGKQGCPKCGRIVTSSKTKFTTDEWIAVAKEVQGDRYDYSKVNYIDGSTKVCIICPKHGEFWQDPSNHIHLKHGCPKCGNIISSPEKGIVSFLRTVLPKNDIIKENVKNIIDKELDIFVPKYNIAIEFNGLYWHSEIRKYTNYHLDKTKKCEEKGIKLIHIFEDEWRYKQEIVKSMLKNMFNKTETKLYARKCEIKEVPSNEASKFLNENHLQGKCGSSVKIGLYYNNELVSLMTFGKSRHFIGNGKNEWELLRFCNKLNTNVVGGASKLLNHFIKNYKPNNMVSYADRRWSCGNLYEKLGFTKYNTSRPNYYYVIGQKRHYRFNYRKSILIKKYNCPENMSEHEFCLSQKWYRIYDCGCLCYKWEKK